MSEPFEWRLEGDGDSAGSPRLRVIRSDNPKSVTINAKIRGVSCFLASFKLPIEERSLSICFMGVTGVQVVGTAEVLAANETTMPRTG